MQVLLLNAGSSSLKCTLLDSDTRSVVGWTCADWAGSIVRYSRSRCEGQQLSEEVRWGDHGEALRMSLRDLGLLPGCGSLFVGAVGHRIVHGGDFSASVRVAPEVRSRIAALAELAPLHNPPGLETLTAAQRALPNVPHVAVFDTAFHATLPCSAGLYAVPMHWSAVWGVRRYGFHGLSHAYCARRAAALLGRRVEELRLVICHLGSGCSAAAVLHGRCIDTTMGFTPLDGLMMATRCGALDPGILLHLQLQRGLTPKELEKSLHRESGLLGVSGVSGDMREVLDAARAGNERARLALQMYVHRVRQAVGALTATLGGIDALVFTAGVGENSADVRALSCQGLECLGVRIDEDANAACQPDADIARTDSAARVLVIATREDLTMLDEVQKVLA